MPNRIILERCCTSPNLDRITDFAERTFWRLTTKADDFGRFEAEAAVVASNCFPRRNGQNGIVDDVESALRDMVKEDLVKLYEIKGRRYGYFLTWEDHQTKRAKHSKYPAPANK